MSDRLEASPSELVSYQRWYDTELLRCLQRGLYLGAAVGLALVLPTWLAFPEAGRSVLLLPLVASVTMLLASLATRIPGMSRAARALVCVSSYAVAGLAALAAARTGGFQSPYFYVHFMITTFGTAFLPASPRLLVMSTFPNLLGTCVVILVVAPDHTGMALPVLLSAASLLYAFFGVRTRHAADLQSFVAHARLAEVKGSLASLNAELEHRVSLQVAESVKRADDVAALNAQLRERVTERSRELAQALRALEQHHTAGAIPEGAVLGGRVTIERLVGSGGMGAVYLGRDLVTDRRVAVKVMSRETGAGPLAIRRFLTEAAAAAAIAHPAIVKTEHVDVSAEGTVFLLMEHVDGVPLHRLLRRIGRVPPAMTARIGEAIARALAAAHDQGVIHRDVKPSNIMLSARGTAVRVLDFGIAKIAGHATTADPSTVVGALLGTPAYMAPEQAARSSSVTPACDVYALGVLLYELVSAVHPFAGRNELALLFAHTNEAPRPLSEANGGVPEALAALIAAAMAKDPLERPSARSLADGLAPLAMHADEVSTLLSRFESETLAAN